MIRYCLIFLLTLGLFGFIGCGVNNLPPVGQKIEQGERTTAPSGYVIMKVTEAIETQTEKDK